MIKIENEIVTISGTSAKIAFELAAIACEVKNNIEFLNKDNVMKIVDYATDLKSANDIDPEKINVIAIGKTLGEIVKNKSVDRSKLFDGIREMLNKALDEIEGSDAG